jgi:hypothetical protein
MSCIRWCRVEAEFRPTAVHGEVDSEVRSPPLGGDASLVGFFAASHPPRRALLRFSCGNVRARLGLRMSGRVLTFLGSQVSSRPAGSFVLPGVRVPHGVCAYPVALSVPEFGEGFPGYAAQGFCLPTGEDWGLRFLPSFCFFLRGLSPPRGWVGSGSGFIYLEIMTVSGGRAAGSVPSLSDRAVTGTRPTSMVASCGFIVLDLQASVGGPCLIAMPYRVSAAGWEVHNFHGEPRRGEFDRQTAVRALLEKARLCFRKHCLPIAGPPYVSPSLTDRQRVPARKKVVLFLCYLQKSGFRQQLVLGRGYDGVWWEDLHRLGSGELSVYPAWVRDQARFVLTRMPRPPETRLHVDALPVPRHGAATFTRCVDCLPSAASVAAFPAGAQKSCRRLFCRCCVRTMFRDSYVAVLHRCPACPVCRSVVQVCQLVRVASFWSRFLSWLKRLLRRMPLVSGSPRRFARADWKPPGVGGAASVVRRSKPWYGSGRRGRGAGTPTV